MTSGAPGSTGDLRPGYRGGGQSLPEGSPPRSRRHRRSPTWRAPWKGNALTDAKLRGWHLADTGPAEAAPGPGTAPPGPCAAPSLATERGEASKQKIDVAAFIPGKSAPLPPAGADHRTGLLLPAAITPGTDKYYQLRARDFMRRHPEMSPPDYYLSYGDYYMRTLLGINFPTKAKPCGWKDTRCFATSN